MVELGLTAAEPAPLSYSNGVSADDYCGGGMWSFFETVGGFLTKNDNFAALVFPAIFLFLYGTYYTYRLTQRKPARVAVNNWMYSMKIFLAVLVLCSQSVLLGNSIVESFRTSSIDFQYVAMPLCLAIASLEVLIIMIYEHRLGQFVEPKGDYMRLGVEDDESDCPEHTAPLLSRLTFWWMTPTMRDGWDHSLQHDELFGLDIENQVGHISETFDRNWQKEVSYCAKYGGSPSLVRALAKSFGRPYILAGALKFVQDVCAFVSPQILKQLICFTKHEDIDIQYGYLFSALLFCFAAVQSIVLHQYFHRSFATGMRVRAAIVAAIYQKSLVVSNTARKGTTVGEITNLMSVDAQRFMDLLPYMHMIWSGPLQITLAMYFLWDTMGPSVLAGVAVLVLTIPINAVVARFIRRFQVNQMRVKDHRMKFVNEVLAGMKVIKLYAWEKPFLESLGQARKDELKVLKQIQYFGAGTSFIWNTTPFMVSLVTFLCYVALGNQLSAEKAFVALSLLNLLQFPVVMFPNVINSIIEASVALNRVHKFLTAEEIDRSSVEHIVDTNVPHKGEWGEVDVENGTFAWSSDESPILKKINLTVEGGELVCIAGRVGSGKSSLISAILGEMSQTAGTVRMNGSLAYVPQQAWIQNATVKDNILFGKPYERERYEEVIYACALKDDLKMLDDGDETEIGEKGINLSGGQKQRISLARALYQNCDIYILDDPLSAVDVHVGRHIFDKVLGPDSLLKNKTRLLVTHKIEFLPQCSRIVVLRHGYIDEVGDYDTLRKNGGEFSLFLEEFTNKNETDDEGSELSDNEVEAIDESTNFLRKKSSSSRKRHGSSASLKHEQSTVSVQQQPAAKLIEAETAATGTVKLNVYSAYLQAVGLPVSLVILMTYVLSQGFQLSSSVWLSHWSSVSSSDPQYASDHWGFYLGIYGAWGIGFSISTVFVAFVCAFGSITASQKLHDTMLHNIMRCPMSFFDTTPLGRIVNRFSKDMYTVDESLPSSMRALLGTLFKVLGTIFIISYSTPIFLTVVLPMSVVYILVQRFYVATSRQLKRLDSVSRSPVFAHFGETLNGVSTIRAYKQQVRFRESFEGHLDYNQQAYYPSVSSNRWLAVRLELNGNFIVFFAALFAVLARGHIDPSTVGLSISYAMGITQSLNWIVRMTSELETNIVAVERVKEYSEVTTEAPAIVPGNAPPTAWPTRGEVTMKNVCVRYRQGLPNVLKGVSVDIKSAEKIGVVGRTGAGKSSLTLALFRLMELSEGKILIDGIDLAEMGLENLRSRLTIIPQDPVMFSGTLRSNLDPFNTYDEVSLWNTIANCHLTDYVNAQALKLDAVVSEDGNNLSVGQRQLVCLGRALLRKTKILVLDEATAACDLETDELIQSTIRSEFKDCTIITIAHRLKTIMDSDRILVLDAGKVAEFDSPANLLANSRSIFYGLVKEDGTLGSNNK
eukprot:CFRG8215T1